MYVKLVLVRQIMLFNNSQVQVRRWTPDRGRCQRVNKQAFHDLLFPTVTSDRQGHLAGAGGAPLQRQSQSFCCCHPTYFMGECREFAIASIIVV